MKIKKIAITGIDQTSKVKQHPDSFLTISRSFRTGKRSRGKTVIHDITLKDEDIVEFAFDDGTVWLSNPYTLEEIFPEAEKISTRGGVTRFIIPTEITAPATERGIIKKAVLKVINILSQKAVQYSVARLARELEDKQLEGKTGLFRLGHDFQLLDYNKESNEKPFCLFIHGTASSVSGSFSDIRETDLMRFLRGCYGDRILAFQHRTLTENPLQNVRDLLREMPPKCSLHLITLSRGGLVGEVLSRFCNFNGSDKGFTNDELEFFRKEYPDKYFESVLSVIDEIKNELISKNIIIEKFIRIACPAGGTTLLSERLDNFFNIAFNLAGIGTGLVANPVFLAFRNLVAAVINTKNRVNVLPGLEVQRPDSPFIKVINGWDIPNVMQINNSLAVISGNSNIEFKLSALLIIAGKLFFGRENDLVVDSVSMSLGTPRSGKVQEFFYDDKEITHFKYFENLITNKAILVALKLKWGEALPEFMTDPVVELDDRDFDMTGSEIDNPLLKLTRRKTVKPVSNIPIKVSIRQGDLTYAQYPVMAGHLEDDSILYAEKQIDKNLDGMLSQYQHLGNYPGKIKDSRIFLTNRKGFQGAIIVGLGRLENLTPSELTKTVEAAVVNYLFDSGNKNLLTNNGDEINTLGISSLIIGCGYGGLTIENSIRAIIEGVYNANISIKEINSASNCVIGHIEFIEIFEDKAINGLFSIHRLEKDETNSFKIVRDEKGVMKLLGSKKRIPIDATEEWWNRLTVSREEDDKKMIRELKFSASTKSAREEQQPLFTSPFLMEGTIKEMSTNDNWTPGRARTIFEMLIPNDFKDELKRHGNIIWVLDRYTATLPWELLHDGSKDTKPICVSSGMVRQLKSADYRKTIKTVTRKSALVVADPKLDGFIGQLDGALAEGRFVTKILSKNGVEVTESFNEDHSDIIEKLFGDEYKIIHLSGHGVYHEDASMGSGMVIGKNMYLSTREIQQMSTVPEFVFVNCCHLGKTDGVAEEYYQERFKLAANIGTQLIINGVKCVIAAGWAVDDNAALEFARVFYQHMIDGDTFGEAVREARRSVYEKYSYTNTWGAYQAYGDPYYRFRKSGDGNAEKSYLIDQEAEIDLENLLSALEIGDMASEKYLEQLDAVSKAVDEAKIRNSKITELDALIYMELREYGKACDKFRELMTQKDAYFSFSSIEKYHNARAKKSIEEYRINKRNINKCLEEIDNSIKDLKDLLKISTVPESFNILGSTYKRKAFLIKQKECKQSAYESAAYYYQYAFSKFGSWYSLTNWLILESIFILAEKHTWKDQVKTEEGNYRLISFLNAHRKLCYQEEFIPKDMEIMNYWDMIAAINIKLCRYILNFSRFNAQKYLDKIFTDISDLWKRAGSKGKRFAEIEHLEFIIDALSIAQNKKTISLRKNLQNMQDRLEGLLEN